MTNRDVLHATRAGQRSSTQRQQKADQALRHASQAEGSDGFWLDFDDLPDGVVVADADGLVRVFNCAAGRMAGTEPAAVLGSPLDQVLPFEDADGRPWWAQIDPYRGSEVRTGEPETRLFLPDGRDVLATVRYVRSGSAVDRVVVSLRDASSRARTQRQHTDLVATVAHELRSPLTSIKGFTATLLAKWDRFTDDQRKFLIENVNADADRVTRLTAELIDISRIDSGRLQISPCPIDVESVVHDQIASMVAAGQEPDRFTVAAGPAPPALADRDRLRQVLANLLENAVRYSDGQISIEIAVLPEYGDAVVVTVDDDGPGIPEELLDHIFTQFWRGSRQGGTGLGLFIVKGIIEAHGGTITAGHAPYGGARFRFTLPAAQPDLRPASVGGGRRGTNLSVGLD